jgi:predicted CopG family antitoxin
MATKTISVDIEAYEVLCRARSSTKESFSKVIKRARWNSRAKTCGDLMAALKDMPVASKGVIAKLEAAQRADAPPEDPWA